MPRALQFFLLMLASGLLAISMSPLSLYGTLGLCSLAVSFSFLLTAARFSDGFSLERAALLLSYIGGHSIILVPILVSAGQYPILPAGNCLDLNFHCTGTSPGVYYSVLNQLMLAGLLAVVASLLFAVSQHGYLVSVPLLMFSAWIFFTTLTSTQLPAPIALLSVPVGAGGFLILEQHIANRHILATQRFSGQIVKSLTSRVSIIILLFIIVGGALGGVWGLGTEAVNSVQVVCATDLERGPSLTLGLWNPSYVPVEVAWTTTYSYNGTSQLLSDVESAQISPHTTAYLRFGFGTLPPNATFRLTTKYDVTYTGLFSSVHREDSFNSQLGRLEEIPLEPWCPTSGTVP